jgi:hypothetical protein
MEAIKGVPAEVPRPAFRPERLAGAGEGALVAVGWFAIAIVLTLAASVKYTGSWLSSLAVLGDAPQSFLLVACTVYLAGIVIGGLLAPPRRQFVAMRGLLIGGVSGMCFMIWQMVEAYRVWGWKGARAQMLSSPVESMIYLVLAALAGAGLAAIVSGFLANRICRRRVAWLVAPALIPLLMYSFTWVCLKADPGHRSARSAKAKQIVDVAKDRADGESR